MKFFFYIIIADTLHQLLELMHDDKLTIVLPMTACDVKFFFFFRFIGKVFAFRFRSGFFFFLGERTVLRETWNAAEIKHPECALGLWNEIFRFMNKC